MMCGALSEISNDVWGLDMGSEESAGGVGCSGNEDFKWM